MSGALWEGPSSSLADDHRAALAEIEGLWGAPEGTDEGDKLDMLLALVDIYETRRWPIEIDETFDPVDVLRYAIGELGHTQAELGELLGSRSRASVVLSRRRALTVEMIHKIGEAWKFPPTFSFVPTRSSEPLERPVRRKAASRGRRSPVTVARSFSLPPRGGVP